MSLYPNTKWFGGLIMLITIYYGYTLVGPLIENTMPDMFRPMVTVYGNENITSMVSNFFVGVVMIFAAALIYLVIAGIPGTEEETWVD